MAGVNADSALGYFQRLQKFYGRQHWWPADDEFEVLVGALLTQNTAWRNVEKAIDEMKRQHLCDPVALAEAEVENLAQVIRSSGYYQQKARRLTSLARWYLEQGQLQALQKLNTSCLRKKLLELPGIGDETADAMLLYAFMRPSFVIDNYTRRLLTRLGEGEGVESYSILQRWFMKQLPEDLELYQQYHALIVEHCKLHCRKLPACSGCPLNPVCDYAHGQAV